jgi:wyosine [tRNA(Phe)-imidazoG37] synthetase (radical SAM superfamily)
MPAEYRYLFGPVPSRRLGHSLGMDLVPFKTCSYDCIYCQLGRTTEKTVTRREYVPVDEMIRELERKLKEPGKIDYVTLAGSGEPTLYSGLGEVVKAAKKMTDIPVAVLTNGSLLWDDAVQKSLAEADLVVPSLDAGSADLFRYVNRPCAALSFHQVVEGIIDFCSAHREKIWLEVFLLAGVNGTKKEIRKFNAIIRKINPAKVQLNTVTRPPAEQFALEMPSESLRELADRLDGPVEIISDFDRPLADATEASGGMEHEVVALLGRRPCSVNDIAGSLNLRPQEVIKYLDALEKRGRLVVRRSGENMYYSVMTTPPATEGAVHHTQY